MRRARAPSIGRRSFLAGALAAPLVGCCLAAPRAPQPSPTSAPSPSAPVAPSRVASAGPVVWDPTRTVVFAAGLLRWARHDLYEGFPRVERRDRALVDTLAARGVPRERITYLHESEATLAATRAALRASIDAAGPSDTFLFYWTGHGDRLESGATFAVPYDAGDDSAASCLGYEEIVRTLIDRGRMQRALLFADTCYAGALADLATTLPGGPPRAGFGSSSASETSTGNWTFTEAIVAGFGGDARADRDRDHVVTLDDLGRFVEEEMAFADGQLASVKRTPDFPDGMHLAEAAAPPCPRYGERVEVRVRGAWWPATITAQPEDALTVHYDGYTERWDETVDEGDTRPYAPTTYAPGTRVSVRWEDDWFPATVRDARLGVHLVHYDDYDTVWDEWVAIDRVHLA